MGNLNNSSNLQLPVPMEVDICDGKIVFLTLKLLITLVSYVIRLLNAFSRYRGPNFHKYMYMYWK